MIFQRFSQADSSTARKFGGSGLGLAISKRLVELMGGKIGFVSEINRGSTFWVTIPMQKPKADMVLASSSNVSQEIPPVIPRYERIRVLLVEDNVVNQKVATGMLKKLGCPFDVAQNGVEAVSMAFQNNYALILMDCEMPEMDGYSATREIRRLEAQDQNENGLPKTHRTIIALTANAMVHDEVRCLACGMDGFLSKPLRKEVLIRELSLRFPAL